MKTKFRRLFIVLTLLSGIHSVLAQPALGISPAGNQSVLFWNTTPTNYILQSTLNLASPNWVYANDVVPVTAVTVSNTSPTRFFRLTNLPAGMVFIPAGSFTMGDTLDGESDAIPTNIYVSAFYMDVNLVSYELWTNVYAYATANAYSFVNAGAGHDFVTNPPVQTVDWYDCVKWCNARSQQAGLTPVYYTSVKRLPSQVFRSGETTNVYVNWTANGFRLPTEAEWEKAARGGLNGMRFPWGNLIGESQANYHGDSVTYAYDFGPDGFNAIGRISGTSLATSPVGSFLPNGYGLYDMAGNLNEWCGDWYGTPYGQPTTTDPTGPATGSYRVMRGGTWASPPASERCATRWDFSPTLAFNTGGFRCVSRF